MSLPIKKLIERPTHELSKVSFTFSENYHLRYIITSSALWFMEASPLPSYIHKRGWYLSHYGGWTCSASRWQAPHTLRIPYNGWFWFSCYAAISKTLNLASSHLLLIFVVLRPPFVLWGGVVGCLDEGLMVLSISPAGRKHQRSISSNVMTFCKQIWQNFWRWWHFPRERVLYNRHHHFFIWFYPRDTVFLVF